MIAPIEIATNGHDTSTLLALKNNASFNWVIGEFKRLIQQRLIIYVAGRICTTRGGDNRAWTGIVDPRGQFMASKTAKYCRVNSTDASIAITVWGIIGI